MPHPVFERKRCPPANLNAQVAQLPRPWMFTNGCFDILHRGHVTYLAEARAFGASLIAGVNSDDSIRRQDKEDDRPINRLEERMALLASLESVSLAIWFDTGTPPDLIRSIRPDVPVKGGGGAIENMVGAREVMEWGGSAHSTPFQHHTSTTALLGKIRG